MLKVSRQKLAAIVKRERKNPTTVSACRKNPGGRGFCPMSPSGEHQDGHHLCPGVKSICNEVFGTYTKSHGGQGCPCNWDHKDCVVVRELVRKIGQV